MAFIPIFFALIQATTLQLSPAEVINTSEGLSNSIVYDIHKDAEGFIWMATDNGLNRYDGYSFRTFYHSDADSTTISGNIVRSIEEDENGNLWIGTFNGLDRFDKATEEFEHFLSLPDSSTNRLDLQNMTLDARGRIWFSNLVTSGWFDIRTSRFEFFQTKEKPYAMTVDDSDQMWLRTQGGTLFKFNEETQNLKEVFFNKQNDHSLIHFGKHSKSLWLSAEVGGYDSKILPTLPGNFETFVLHEMDDTHLLLGTEKGLYQYDFSQNHLQKIDLGEASSVLSESIKSIYQDDTGAIWIGTLNGVFHFNPYQKPLNHLDLLEGQSDVIMGMTEFEQTIIVNTLGEGLFRHDLINQKLTPLHFKGTAPEAFNYVWHMKVVPDAEFPLWLGTNAGLVLYNPDSGAWKHVSLPGKPTDSPPVFAIAESANGHLWVASIHHVHAVTAGGKFLYTVSGLPAVSSIIQDVVQIADELYLATDSGILSVVDLKSESSEPLSVRNEKARILENSPIWDLHLIGQTLWIGTSQGLYTYNIQSHDFTKMKLNDDGGNNIIFSISPGIHNEVWLGTEAGLLRLDLTDHKVRHYGHKDGLVNYEYNRKSVILDTRNNLWFGGVNGLTHFDPKQIRENPVSPPVHINSVTVISKDTSFVQRISDQDEMILPWHKNTLEFNFVALNYSNAQQNRYQYQLEGYDPKWVDSGNGRRARYVQLPPGTYDFMVKGANNDGLWNPTAASLKIKILPAFWQTVWFKVLILLVVATSLYMIYRYRVRRLLEIERLKLRIAGDLHDEVGSGLSSIALSGDLLQDQIDSGEPKPELVSRITSNARHLASSLDDIVWLIDPQKESLTDFINRVRSMAKELLTKMDFTLEDEVDDAKKELALQGDAKRNLFLLTKEVFHNIAKHSFASSVSVVIGYRSSRFHMVVSDNGKGFDLHQKSEGHGLKSIRKRAVELSADLVIDSALDQGTRVSLNMKLP